MKQPQNRVDPASNGNAERDESSRLYIEPLVGTWMEPVLPDDSLNLFRAGVNGSHCGRIVVVGRFTENGPLESPSVGILAIENRGAAWSEQALRVDFLNHVGESIMLDKARYRIISEWITVLDRSTHKPVRAGAFEPPSETEAPKLDDWLTMSKERILRIAAAFPTPPEVFSKYSELVDQQPTLSHTLMTNF